MGKEIDPSDIGKYPEIIKKAQAEMTNMDVLVCGQCNSVFHFLENFREHKTATCTKSSALKDNLETKPVIWSFLLWKVSQLNQDQSKDGNAWALYQSWMKLDEAIKETWVVAGRTIQSFAKIGQGSLQEMPVKITKTVVDNSAESMRGRQLVTNRIVNKTPMSQKELDASFNELKNSDSSTPINAAKRPIARSPQSKNIVSRVAGSTIIASKPGIVTREARRTIGMNTNGKVQTKEHRIEKILAKRFNPRHKEHEYLIKWDNISHENNTWEPASHLETCPVLLDTFEKQLARQKEQRQALQAKQAQAQAQAQAQIAQVNDSHDNKANDSVSSQSEDDSVSGIKRRKLETSPTKAVNNVSSVNASLTRAQVSKIKSNGLQTIGTNEKSADVVITNDKKTGIVKKSGVSVNPTPKNEAQIRFIQKGGDSVSGVVRVGTATNQVADNRIVQKLGNTTVKPVHNIARTPAKVQQPKTNVAAQHVQSIHQLSPINANAKAAVKPTITRVVKSTPTSKPTTPEQKIAALTRQGNIKVTRKTVNTPINSQDIALQSEEDYTVTDTFAANIEPKPEPQDQQLPIVATQILSHGSSVALIDASQLEQSVNEIKKEGEDIVMNEEQLQQLQQSGVITTDQEGLQQILASHEDGTQQLIQFVTGEDGTIYQVAGKNEQGQTILIAQGADGEQQCVYVAAEDSDALGLDDANNGAMTLNGLFKYNLIE